MTQYIYPPIDSAPSDIYQRFVTVMQAFIPNWKPASGNLDDFMAQGMAAITAQLSEITSDVATSIYRFFGAFIANLPPLAASPAQGFVSIVAVDTLGHDIPAFTSYIFTAPDGSTQGFHTLNDATIPVGSSSVNGVAVIADLPGAAGDNITGTGLPVLSFAWLQSVTLQAATNNGQDAEDDDTYLNRLRGLYTLLTPKCVLPQDFSQFALNSPNVGRAVTLDTFDPANQTIVVNLASGSQAITGTNVGVVPVGAPVTGANIPVGSFVTEVNTTTNIITISSPASANATGESITVGGSLLNGGEVYTVFTDTSGLAPTSAAISAMQASLQAKRLSCFKVGAAGATYTTFNVSATLYAWAGQNPTTVQTAVATAIQNFLNPANWGLPPGNNPTGWLNDSVVRYNALWAAILAVPGVHYIGDLTINGQRVDQPMPGVVPLPLAGTVSATVNLG